MRQLPQQEVAQQWVQLSRVARLTGARQQPETVTLVDPLASLILAR